MVSQLKLLKESRKKGTYKIVDSNIDKKIRSYNKKRKGDTSPTENDIERIIRDYVDDDFTKSIINKKTAILAVESLEEGNAIYGDSSDFRNFISAVGKDKMAERIQELFQEENFLNLLQEEIELKTKKIRGFKWNDEIYLRETKAGIRAFTFKNNRFAKIPKNLFKNIK